ncbi:GNAT family N-acetyltransferase [Vibrio vulnificus]|uniref:GNAT family N-acetyltransferase n=1 Tax=Vibrio vulnificus TaxID=672 RepID=UPI00165DDBB3|nr:GNAT family N-acetyltransferase [Vibrio vulnificus]EGQ8075498.1 GNAT family N-acetyltransferase [Vibrio vulnificus]EGQ8080029.1 GNAT family N-acetyltransferase [Vibrio vulnificus]EGR0395126.1 GNAT family N-acetyltransferase [Vibrio vulnificus]EHG1331793.1 GNAT family N-acetyltransferase [Vibrio vulnificus]EHK8978170.1 GNAT family N-acetyltransferase [Vibrio vulnificus]
MYMIERATIDDIEKLVEIQVSAFENDRKQCGSGPPGFDSHEYQTQCLERYSYFVIKSSSNVVGGFYYSLSEENLSLIRLFVDPNFQRQGLGENALNFLINQVRTGMYIELETPTFSVEVQRFYEKSGFQKVQRIQYPSGSSYLYRKLC